MEYLITCLFVIGPFFSLNKKEFIEGEGWSKPFSSYKKRKKMEGGNVQSTISKEGTSLIVWTTKLADLRIKIKSQQTKKEKDF